MIVAQKTNISWCDSTWSPWWGCTKVSPACDHCYADTFSHRLGLDIWGKDAPRRFFGDEHWSKPLKWNQSAQRQGKQFRVFCGSMCDVMEDRRDLDEARQRLYGLIEATPSLDWLLLTKRPQNFRRFFPASWLQSPRPNVWIMTTVESPDYLWRIDALQATPAFLRGLSVEPLLADIPTIGDHLSGISWVIVGGESGHGARPMHPDGARRIRDECLSRGIAFHFKQRGEFTWDKPEGPVKNWLLVDRIGSIYPNTTAWNGRTGADSETGEVYMYRVGKKKAGNLLDGVQHLEFPATR